MKFTMNRETNPYLDDNEWAMMLACAMTISRRLHLCHLPSHDRPLRHRSKVAQYEDPPILRHLF